MKPDIQRTNDQANRQQIPFNYQIQ